MAQFGNRNEYHKMIGERIFGKDNCPFCSALSGGEDILWEGKHWFILYNIYPYSGDDQHLMAIPRIHKAFSHELNEEEMIELGEAYRFMKIFYSGKRYFSFTRETIEGRSVEHLHIHFLAGVLEGRFLRKMLELQGFPITEDLKLE